MKLKFFIISIWISALSTFCQAQPLNKITGTWEGVMVLGVELRVVFNIKIDEKDRLFTTVDSPDQSVYGIKCDTTFIHTDTIMIIMKKLGATYTGKIMSDLVIEGTFIQLGPANLQLKKVEKASVKKKSQAPVPPFPYISEDIIYYNADKSLQFGGTITIPERKGRFPAALLISGSGQQNRDGEIMGHKPFAVIADYLTKKGFIVLRVDDRGVGKSTGIFDSSTSFDFAKDVKMGIDYLLTRSEVEKTKIGLIGHSEGGMIAPMVASERQDINFIILLAGPGVKIIDLMSEQNTSVLKSIGISKKSINTYRPFYKKLISEVSEAKDTVTAFAIAKETLNGWVVKTDKKVLKELNFETVENQEKMVAQITKKLSSPWQKYFISFDPSPYLKKLHCKVLALNGEKDIQVIAKQNLTGIKKALKRSNSKTYNIIQLSGMNHLFQKCESCTIQEYSQLEESFSPSALKIIGDWLLKNVK
jgi:uncharacterized protein